MTYLVKSEQPVAYPQQQAAHPLALPSTGSCAHTEYWSGRGVLLRHVQPFQIVLKSPVRSGFLPFLALTKTETG